MEFMFCFHEFYFLLMGIFNWGCARTQFFFLVSQNRYGFALVGYRNGKSATDPGLVEIKNYKFSLIM